MWFYLPSTCIWSICILNLSISLQCGRVDVATGTMSAEQSRAAMVAAAGSGGPPRAGRTTVSSGVSRQAWSGERATLAGTACTDHPNPSNVLQPYLYKLSISPEYTRSCFFLSFALRCASPALLGSLPAAPPAPPAPAVEAVEAVEYDMDACCKKID